MRLQIYRCSRCVGKNPDFIKYGKTANGKQRYQCTGCRKTSVLEYSYNAYSADTDNKIIQLTKEGMGIRSTAHIQERVRFASKTPPACNGYSE